MEEAVPDASPMAKLACLSPEDFAEDSGLDPDDLEEMDAFPNFKYQEALTWKLEPWANQYILKKFIYTDGLLKVKNSDIYQLKDGKHIVFY